MRFPMAFGEKELCATPSDAASGSASWPSSSSSRVHPNEDSSILLCNEDGIEVAEDDIIVGDESIGCTAGDSMDIDTNIVNQIALQIRDDLNKQSSLRQQQAPSGTPSSLGSSCHLTPEHRAIIVGWMREVSGALELQLSTLFTAVSILDRYVAATKALPPDNLLQLLALACMSVAVKYNEAMFVPTLTWLSMAVDSDRRLHYRAVDLHDFEMTVLQAIGWRLHEPNTYSFLVQYLVCLKQAPAALVSDIQSTPSYPQGLQALLQHGSPLWHWFAQAAENLAITSISYDTFLPYKYSTIALACISLAVNMVAISAGMKASGIFDTADVVGSITGLQPEHLAPGNSLGPCAQELDRAYRWMLYCICSK